MNEKLTLTVGFCTRDDFAGAWMTLGGLLEYHKDFIDEIVIIDNSPKDSKHAALLQEHVAHEPIVRYIRVVGPESSCIYKDRVFRAAKSDIVLCCDSHVLFGKNAIASLRKWFESNPNSKDLITGPMSKRGGADAMTSQQQMYVDEKFEIDTTAELKKKPIDRIITQNNIVWRGGNCGIWRLDDRALDSTHPAFPIAQNGTGAFACLRSTWPGFHPQFIGFGGNETWLMERFRELGGQVLCLPTFRWIHRFGYPDGHKYKISWDDRVRNYLIGFNDLDRPDLYDSAVGYFKHICPKALKKCIDKIPRPAGHLFEIRQVWSPAQVPDHKSGAIPVEMFHVLRRLIRSIIPNGSVLEFGSGMSTLLCDRMGIPTVTVEHDMGYFEKVKSKLISNKVDLRLCPIENNWYSWRPKRHEQFDLVIIDGPPGSIGRSGVLNYLADCLAPAATIVLDDTHRKDEDSLSRDLAGMYGFDVRRHHCGSRAFDVLSRRADISVYNEGVGTELKAILQTRFGMELIPSCGCNGKMKQMNYRGVTWCKENRDKITNWLLDGAKVWQSLGPDDLPENQKRAPWVVHAPAFAQRIGIHRILNEAIKRAESKADNQKENDE